MLCHEVFTHRSVTGIRLTLNEEGRFGIRVGTPPGPADRPAVFIPLSTELQETLVELPAWALDGFVPRPEHLDVPDGKFAHPLRVIAERDPNDGYALVLVRVKPGWAAGVDGMRGQPVAVEYQSVPYPEPQPFPPPGVRIIRGGAEPEALIEMAPGARIRIVRGGYTSGGWGIMDVKNEGHRLKFYFPERQQQQKVA